MNDWFSLLVAQSWQVALLALSVWLVALFFAKDRPHLAHAIWLLVLLKCLTPPVVSSPASPFSWLASSRLHDPLSTEIEPASLTNGAGGVAFKSSIDPIVVHVQPENDATSSSEKDASNAAVNHDACLIDHSGRNNPRDWKSAILWVWISGAMLGFTVVSIRYVLFLYWLQNSSKLDDPRIKCLVAQLSKRLGIRRQVRVLVLENPVGPAVLGLLRPTVLLPAAIVKNQTPDALRPLLAHELIHIRRGDLWWALVQSLAISLFWFHPLVWFAVRMVTRESERSCDEETVASLGCRPAVYARRLLGVLEHKHQLRVAPALPGVRPVDITSARLERVMRLGTGSHRRTPIWVWLVLFVCGVLVLPGAAVVIGQQTAERLPQTGEPLKAQLLPPLTPPPSAESWSIETHDVGELLQQLKKLTIQGQTPEQKLISMLPCRHPDDLGNGSTPAGRHVQLSDEFGVHHLGDSEPTIKIVQNKLYVFDTKEQLEAISKLLGTFEEYGFQQVMVEVQFLTMAQDQIRGLGIEWSIAESTLGNSVSLALDDKNSWVPVPANNVDQLISSTMDPTSSPTVRATSYVEKSTPVLYSILDASKLQPVINTARSHQKTNVLTAPKVTLFNGQKATVKDTSVRPFVVGLDRVKGPSGKLSDPVQPVVRTVEVGTSIQLKPTLKNETSVQLDCRMVLSTIRSVETAKIPLSTDQEPVQIQVPEVATTQIHSSMEVPLRQTLVMNSLREDPNGKNETLLVLVKCHLVDSETLSDSSLDPTDDSKSTDDDLDSADAPNEASEKPETILMVRSGDTNGGENADGVVRSINMQGFQLKIGGNVQCDITKQGTAIRGKKLTIRSEEDDEFSITGDEGEIQIEQDGKCQARFVGNVIANLDGTNFAADQLEIEGHVQYKTNHQGSVIRGKGLKIRSEANGEFGIAGDEGEIQFEQDGENLECLVRFVGNVKANLEGSEFASDQLQFDGKSLQLNGTATMRSDESEMAAESIHINQDDGFVELKGAAKMNRRPKPGESNQLHADWIQWNPITNRIEAKGTKSATTDR